MKIPKPGGLASIASFGEFVDASVSNLKRIEAADPTFPPRVQISARRFGYRWDDILAWVTARPKVVERNAAATAAATAVLAAKRRAAKEIAV